MATDPPTPMAPASGVSERDYEALLATLSSSAAGRGFLAEFARRNRMTETDMLLAALARLEAMIVATQQPPVAAATVEPAAAVMPSARHAVAAAPDQADGSESKLNWFVETLPPVAKRAAPAMPSSDAPVPQPPANPLAQLMALSEEERLALFT